MEISDQDLRSMIRDAIARHGRPEHPAPAAVDGGHAHVSHGRLTLVTGGDADGRCIIEPAVPCTHCGYCQSMGH